MFTLGQKSEAAAGRVAEFVGELASVLEHLPPEAIRDRLEADPEQALAYDFQRQAVKFIFSLREDFLPHLDAWQARMPSLLRRRFRLERMTGAEAFLVVRQAGSELVSPAVAREIVEFVSASQRKRSSRPVEQREVEPALLSVVCDELNRRRRERDQAQITPDLLTGEREGIIERFYERAFEGVPATVRDWVEDRLLTYAGYRQRAAWEDALKAGLPAEAFELLVDRRVLHREERDNVVWLELTHDLLSDPAAHSRALRQQRREAEAAVQREQDAKRLLEETARREREARRALRRSRVLSGVFAVLLVLALGATAYAWWMRQHALAAERSAQAAEKAARAAAAHAQEAETQMGFQSAQDFFASDRSSAALAFLARVLRRNPADRWVAERILCALAERNFPLPAAEPVRVEGPLTLLVTSPDERFLGLASNATNVWVRQAQTGQVIAGPLIHDRDVAAIQFSPDGTCLVTATLDGTARIWNAQNGQLLTEPLRHGNAGVGTGQRMLLTDLLIEFSPDGEQVLIGHGTVARLWSTRSGQRIGDPMQFQDPLLAARFILDQWHLVTCSREGQVRIWRSRDPKAGTNLAVRFPDEFGGRFYSYSYGGDAEVVWHPSVQAEFSRDGKFLATSGAKARVWDAHTGELIAETIDTSTPGTFRPVQPRWAAFGLHLGRRHRAGLGGADGQGRD